MRIERACAIAAVFVVACASGGGGGGGGDDDGDDDAVDGGGDGDGGNGGTDHGAAWSLLPAGTSVRLSIAPDGDLFVGGSFRDSITIDGTTLTSAGGFDIFVARFAPDGSARWVRRYGGANDEQLADLDAGATGAAVVGVFHGAVDFGGGNLRCPSTLTWCTDLFVLRLDQEGAHRWSADTTGEARGHSVALDDTNDRVLVVGEAQGATDAGTGTVCFVDYTCGLVVLYGANGQALWTTTLRPTRYRTASYKRAVIAPGGLAIVLGEAEGRADVVRGTTTYPVTTPWNPGTSVSNDVVLSAFAMADGAHQWSRRYGGASDDRATGLALDGDQLLVAMYGFGVTVMVQYDDPLGDVDTIVGRIQLSGTGSWSRRYGGFDGTLAGELFADIGGRRRLAGQFTERATFAGTTLEATGEADAYVLDLDTVPTSEPSVALSVGGPGVERIGDVQLLAGRLVVAGETSDATRVMGVDVPAMSSFVIAAAP